MTELNIDVTINKFSLFSSISGNISSETGLNTLSHKDLENGKKNLLKKFSMGLHYYRVQKVRTPHYLFVLQNIRYSFIAAFTVNDVMG